MAFLLAFACPCYAGTRTRRYYFYTQSLFYCYARDTAPKQADDLYKRIEPASFLVSSWLDLDFPRLCGLVRLNSLKEVSLVTPPNKQTRLDAAPQNRLSIKRMRNIQSYMDVIGPL